MLEKVDKLFSRDGFEIVKVYSNAQNDSSNITCDETSLLKGQNANLFVSYMTPYRNPNPKPSRRVK